MKTSYLASVVSLTLIFNNILHAQTIVWTNTVSGGWNTAGNWSPNTIPGASNTAIINQPGVTVTLNGTTSVSNIVIGTNSGATVTLSLNSQTLDLSGALTVNASGSFTVDSGALDGASGAVLKGIIGWTGGDLRGVLTLAGTLNINGTTLPMPNCLFTNNGTVSWIAGHIVAGAGGTEIDNVGLWNSEGDLTFDNSGQGGTIYFTNVGTFRKSAGTATGTALGAGFYFINVGTVDVQTGTLLMEGGGSFTGGTATNLNGILQLAGGNFTVNGTVTASSVELNGADLAGVNLLQGEFTWISGNWNSSTVTIAADCQVNIEGGEGVNDLANSVITNLGTVAWSSGHIRGGASGTEIDNAGLWNSEGDLTFDNSAYAGSIYFTNLGTFRKSVGTATGTTLGAGLYFINDGAVDVQAGTLLMEAGGSFTGGTATNLNGILQLASGNFTINGTVTASSVQLNGADLAGVNLLQGGFTWISGNWNGSTVTIAANCQVNIEGGTGDNDFANSIITNLGTVAWSSGHIRGGASGTEIDNSGLWNSEGDLAFDDSGYGGTIYFTNLGTFRKSAGTATGTTLGSGLTFINDGVMDVQTGVLALESGGSFAGGTATNMNGTLQLAGGTFNVNGTTTSTNVQILGGAILTGANIFNGAITWVAGEWNAVTVTVATNSLLNIITPADHDFPNSTITNLGTVTWNDGAVRGGAGGTVIYNIGEWNAQNDQTLTTSGYGGTATFNNSGTFLKSAGTTNGTVAAGGVVFNNTGTINVETGALILQGGGTWSAGSTVVNAPNFIQLAGGSYNINGTTTSTNVQILSGAALTGVNVLNGGINWVAGEWSGVTVTVAGGSLLDITTPANHDFPDCIITNLGTVAWNDGVVRGGSSGTAIYNIGLWNAQNDQTLNDGYGGTTTFNNSGTFLKSAGTTNGTVIAGGVVFNNTGMLNVPVGAVILDGGGAFTGGWATNTAGFVQLEGGTYTINGTITSTNVQIQSGATLSGINVFAGGINWVAGEWSGVTLTVATNSLLEVTTPANHDFPNCTVTNLGTVAWYDGVLRAGASGSAIYNIGLWNALNDQTLNDAYGGTTTFNNSGTFRKSAGTTNGTVIAGGVVFNNSGVLDSQMGLISLQGTYNITNGTLNFGINGLTNYGTISLTGAAVLGGTVSANLNNGYQPIGGNSFTNLIYGSFTGTFTNAVLPFLDAWTTNYTATNFYLHVLNARPTLVAVTNQSVDELTTLVLTNVATDPDQPPQTLTFSLAQAPSGMTINSGTGVLKWTPAQTNSPSTNTITVVVTDNGIPALSVSNTFTVTVIEVNVAPSLPTIATQTVNELTLLTVTNTATNANIHSTNIGYALISPPSGMTISANGIITWTPAQTESPGTNTITTVVTNSNPYDTVHPELTSTNTFTVIVKEINVAPTLPVIANKTVNVLATLTVTNTASETNIHAATTSYGVPGAPVGVAISTNGIITWTPSQSEGPSTNTITTIVTNTDSDDLVHPHLTATNSFQVIVYAPSLSPIGNYAINPGQTVSFTASARDNDSTRTLTFSLGTAPSGAAINSGTGAFLWRAPVSYADTMNTVQVKVTANSTPSDTVTQSFLITVNSLEPVTLTAISKNATQFELQVNGSQGPDYILESAKSLKNPTWLSILTNTPGSLPFDMTTTNVTTTNEFYRIKLGP